MATHAEGVVERTIKLVQEAPTQEEQIHYVMSLRTARDGWTEESRRAYLTWFTKSAVFQGGKSFSGYLRNARDEFIRDLDEKQRELLKPLVEASLHEQDPYAELKARPIVKQWTVADLLPEAKRFQSGT